MKTVRLLVLSVLFMLLFNEPIIAIVSLPKLVAGVPILYLYVLLIWALLIGLLAYVIHQSPPSDDSLYDDD